MVLASYFRKNIKYATLYYIINLRSTLKISFFFYYSYIHLPYTYIWLRQFNYNFFQKCQRINLIKRLYYCTNRLLHSDWYIEMLYNNTFRNHKIDWYCQNLNLHISLNTLNTLNSNCLYIFWNDYLQYPPHS